MPVAGSSEALESFHDNISRRFASKAIALSSTRKLNSIKKQSLKPANYNVQYELLEYVRQIPLIRLSEKYFKQSRYSHAQKTS